MEKPIAPWLNMFKNNRNLGQGIKLEAIKSTDEVVILEEEDVDDVEVAGGFCLVGYFAGWLVFKFMSDDDRNKVLNEGPYFIFGRPLLLKIMPKCFEFGDEGVSDVSVWVNLPDLPLDCWNAKVLSKIVSKIGKPIATDKLTHTKERLSYARVMRSPMTQGIIRKQPIVYEYQPRFCKECKTFGHSTKGCKTFAQASKGVDYGLKIPMNSGSNHGQQHSIVDPEKETERHSNELLDTSSPVICAEDALATQVDHVIVTQMVQNNDDYKVVTGKKKKKKHGLNVNPIFEAGESNDPKIRLLTRTEQDPLVPSNPSSNLKGNALPFTS
ncbi:hypothetical protein ACJIZ3_023980 [Penstemon smallii]|uniref:DUF4283 domain-containing protein n=1 Tax=Penstemon smallii TaxID=265156 RepID=A0ABD3TQJ3_9LAMI